MREYKYRYLWVVQGDYGSGWEDLTASDDRKEARQDLHDYNKNETGYTHRVIQRRELRKP